LPASRQKERGPEKWRFYGMVDTPIRYTAHSRGSATAMRMYRVWQSIGRHNISIMAAGIAYYAMLSIFPGMSALVLTYGLVADPQTIERHVSTLTGVLPEEALKLLADQLNALVSTPSEGLGIGLIISVVVGLWSSTSGVSAMMNALTVAYESKEERGILHFYGLSIALTVAGVIFVLLSLVLIAGVPAAAAELPLPEFWKQLLPLLRFPMLAVLALVAIGTLYRLAPDREHPGWDFFRPGTVAASLLWLAGSSAFSFYASHFGAYDHTYGSVGAVAIMLVWFYVSAYIILAGAELNGESLRSDEG
jgi:membrane protein